MSKAYLKKIRGVIDGIELTEIREKFLSMHKQAEKSFASKDKKSFKQDVELIVETAKRDGIKGIRSPGQESFRGTVIAVLLALFIRGFIVEPFHIPSGSMIPTLLIRDHLFVTKLSYGIRIPFTTLYLYRYDKPKPSDVVVFINPQKPEEDWIKRVVGIEGDLVEIKNNRLLINGNPVSYSEKVKFKVPAENGSPSYYAIRLEEKLSDESNSIIIMGDNTNAANMGPFRVKKDHVFVMGDNRDNSVDSRFIGQIPISHVIGRALFIWWAGGENWFNPDRIFDPIR